jgi:hypothetical protein
MPPNPPNSVNPLSPDRAFVVQLRQPSNATTDAMTGRVEHIASGRTAFFRSLAELSEFMGMAPRSSLSKKRS